VNDYLGSDHNNIKKRSIFLCPGPEYLFWTGGVYVAWELSKKFKIILIADHYIRNIDKIEDLKKRGVISEFIQYSEPKKMFFGLWRVLKRQLYFKRISESLFKQYAPAVIIQHTDLGPPNIYLVKAADSHKVLKLIYHPSALAKNNYNDYVLIETKIIEDLKRKYKIPRVFVKAFVSFRKIFSYFFNYYVTPFVLTGHVFRPRLACLPKGKGIYNNNRGYYDYFITYSEWEKELLLNNGEREPVIVESPIKTMGDEANLYLYKSVTPMDQILILPTSGEIDYIKKTNNITIHEAGESFVGKWTEVLSNVCVRLPNYKLYLKLHPMHSREIVFDAAIQKLCELFNITMLSSQDPAEKHILRSKVIISSASTVLWWASQQKQRRLLFSLDLWNVPEGSKYKGVDGIEYINDLKKLQNIDLKKRLCDFQVVSNASNSTLTGFIDERILAQ